MAAVAEESDVEDEEDIDFDEDDFEGIPLSFHLYAHTCCFFETNTYFVYNDNHSRWWRRGYAWALSGRKIRFIHTFFYEG